MGFLNKIFGKGISDVINDVANVVDRFSLSKEEKQAFQLELQSRLLKMEQELEETYRAELEARKEIIKAEMAQGDAFTKRARPAIVYAGLIFIFIIYVLVPVFAYIGGGVRIPNIELPEEFWWSWSTVVGIYGVGRSAEKMGVTNTFTNLMTGSGAHKLNKNADAKG